MDSVDLRTNLILLGDRLAAEGRAKDAELVRKAWRLIHELALKHAGLKSEYKDLFWELQAERGREPIVAPVV